MKNKTRLTTYLLAAVGCLFTFSATTVTGATVAANGEAEFKHRCSACHPDGGNIIRFKKSLSKKDREKNGVNTSKEIIKIMRKPGDGMTTFDEKTLPEQEAQRIADYIISNIK